MSFKEILCAQGSAEWHAARIGRPTASLFKKIVTSTGALSKQRDGYAAELLTERLTGELRSGFTSAEMDMGHICEPRARAEYELQTGRSTRTVGFCYPSAEETRWGASPDFLCADRGGEIKSMLPHNAVWSLLAPEDDVVREFSIQVQGGMWVCGFDLWDLVIFGYHETVPLPTRIITVKRDAKICAAFDEAIPAFCDELDHAEAKLRAMGGGASPMGMRDQFAELQ